MIEETIISALSATFGSRVFPDTAPPGTAMPFCVYQQVGGQTANAFCGGSAKRNSRIQIWVWSMDRKTTTTKILAAEAALTAGSPIMAVSLGGFVSRYDDATKTYGAQQDFSVWS